MANDSTNLQGLNKKELRQLAQTAASRRCREAPGPPSLEVRPQPEHIERPGPLAFAIQASPKFAGHLNNLLDSIQQFHPESPVTVYTYAGFCPIAYEADVIPRGPTANIVRDRPGIIRDQFTRYDKVCFLDADTELFQPLTEATALLDDYDLVMCLHEGHIYTHYNAGFQLWRRYGSGLELLQWYENHYPEFSNEQDCLNALLPLFPSAKRWAPKTHNVASCNVQLYNLREEKGVWLTDGGPLVHFHFSGFMPGNPARMSCYYHGPDVANEDIQRFYRAYGERLGL